MLKFIESAERYSKGNHRKLQKVCEPLYKAFGLNYIYYNHITDDGLLAPLGTHLNWVLQYCSTDVLFKEFPFFSRSKLQSSGFYFFDKLNSPNLKETHRIACEQHDLALCATIIKRTKEG